MSHKRQVWETFSQLAQRLLAATEAELAPSPADPDQVSGELKRLGKAQYKANALQEATLEQLRQTVDRLAGREEQVRAQAGHDLLVALLPVLDGLEAALNSGERLLAQPKGEQVERWVVRQLESSDGEREPAAQLLRQSDRALMAAWLDGLRLVRERLLALLDSAGVEPIPTVGQPFDPHRHQAVGTINATDGAHPPGTIVTEQRRGYAGPGGVLRYAEVIVSREIPDPARSTLAPGSTDPEFLNKQS